MAEILVLTTDAVDVPGPLSFTLSALCRASGAGPDWMLGLVGEGLRSKLGPL